MTGGTQEPWYRQLGVDPSEREQAQKEIEALNRRAAVLATTSPERSIALREQSRRLRQSMLEDAPSIEASPSPTSDTEKRDGGLHRLREPSCTEEPVLYSLWDTDFKCDQSHMQAMQARARTWPSVLPRVRNSCCP